MMHKQNSTMSESDTDGGSDSYSPLAELIVSVTDPLEGTRMTSDAIAATLEVDRETVRDQLSEFEWAYSVSDDGTEWAFDRQVVFAESIDDALEQYPDRYSEGDFAGETE